MLLAKLRGPSAWVAPRCRHAEAAPAPEAEAAGSAGSADTAPQAAGATAAQEVQQAIEEGTQVSVVGWSNKCAMPCWVAQVRCASAAGRQCCTRWPGCACDQRLSLLCCSAGPDRAGGNGGPGGCQQRSGCRSWRRRWGGGERGRCGPQHHLASCGRCSRGEARVVEPEHRFWGGVLSPCSRLAGCWLRLHTAAGTCCASECPSPDAQVAAAVQRLVQTGQTIGQVISNSGRRLAGGACL